MKNKTCILLTLSGLLLTGSFAGQNAMAETYGRDGRFITIIEENSCEASETADVTVSAEQSDNCEAVEATGTAVVEQIGDSEKAGTAGAASTREQGHGTQTEAIASDALEQTGCTGDNNFDKAAFQKICARYKPFGMTYDAEKNELWYKEKPVRWFEDYYPVGDGGEAGVDFFNEKGVVDIYAVRDLKNLPLNPDGTLDPGGRLTGLKEFSDEEFAARDIEAIKNPPVQEALAGSPASAQEMKETADEYKPFGVTYNAATEQWYYRGKKVRYFLDILTSNGKKPDGGEFEGAMRIFNGDEGTVDIYTVRDFHTPDAQGNGTLTAVKAYSRQEFDARTRENSRFLPDHSIASNADAEYEAP